MLAARCTNIAHDPSQVVLISWLYRSSWTTSASQGRLEEARVRALSRKWKAWGSVRHEVYFHSPLITVDQGLWFDIAWWSYSSILDPDRAIVASIIPSYACVVCCAHRRRWTGITSIARWPRHEQMTCLASRMHARYGKSPRPTQVGLHL